MKIHRLSLVVIIAIVAIAGLNLGNPSTRVKAEEVGIAYLRAVHASADASNLDLYVNDTRVLENLSYGNASNWLPLPAGQTYEVAIRPTNAPADSDPLAEGSYTLTKDASLAVVALGMMNPTNGEPPLALHAYALNRLDPKGNARIDVIHAAPDTAAIDVLINGGAVIRTLSFGRKNIVPLEVPALDPIDIQITHADQSDQVVLDQPDFRLESGTIYTILAVGTAGNLRALVLTSKPYAAFIRLVHAASDAPPLDVYVDGEFIFGSAYYGGYSNYLNITAGTHDIALRAGNASPYSLPLFEAKGVELAVNSSTLMVAQGLLAAQDDQAFGLGIYNINREPTGGPARLYVVHAATGAPNVDVVIGGSSSPAVRNLRFGRANTVPVPIDPGTSAVTFLAADTENVLINAPAITFRYNTVYTIVAISNGTRVKPLILSAPEFDPLNP
ncbi:MAG: DUF4397 domain-containing protein [Anaerolineae bacterium]